MEFQQRPQEYRAWYKKGYGEKMIHHLTPNDFNRRIPSNAETCMVLMDYIGKLDRNGTKIFAGDIVRVFDWGRASNTVLGVGTIQWDEDELGWNVVNNLPNKYSIIEDRYDFVYKAGFEVIGNIYENPELLSITE